MRSIYDDAIFITDVKLVKMDRPELEVHRLESAPMWTEDEDGYPTALDTKARTEIIRAKKFRARDGRLVAIGASEHVQKILKIPFDAFEDMNYYTYKQQKEINMLWNRNNQLSRYLGKVEKSWGYRIQKTINEYMELL